MTQQAFAEGVPAVAFRATSVPATGYRAYRIKQTNGPGRTESTKPCPLENAT